MFYQAKKALTSASIALGVAATLFVGTALAQSWQFGNHRLIRNSEIPVKYLELRAGGRAALAFYTYVGRVGGAAFEAVAEIASDIDARSLSLQYLPANQDGLRAVLTYHGQSYPIPLYDWQLCPIARFADSEYTGVINLFGNGPDSKHNYYIEYHRAFQDTLMGLRLLQADIMFMDLDNLTSLPKNDKGERITGPGERPAVGGNSEAAKTRVSELLNQHRPQSWILTDIDRTSRLRLRNGRAEVDLNPYFYFWRAEISTVSNYAQMETLLARREAAAREGRTTASIDRWIKSLREQLAREPKVTPVAELTNALDHNRALVEAISPAVSDAAANVARYAALFRALKSRNFTVWQSFVNSLPNSIAPAVQTPNQWKK